jgi:hypothetical protein
VFCTEHLVFAAEWWVVCRQGFQHPKLPSRGHCRPDFVLYRAKCGRKTAAVCFMEFSPGSGSSRLSPSVWSKSVVPLCTRGGMMPARCLECFRFDQPRARIICTESHLLIWFDQECVRLLPRLLLDNARLLGGIDYICRACPSL